MSNPQYTDYRDGIVNLKNLTAQARQVASAMVDHGVPARMVRKKLYDAMNNLQSAVDHIDSDLIGKSSTDREYERDLS